MRRTLVILVAGLLLGACGDDDDATAGDDGDAEAYVEATAASIREDEEGLPLDEAQATCLATGFVDVVGADALREADISPAEFAEAESFAELDVEVPDDATARLADTLRECELVESLGGLLTGTFDDEFGVELTPDAAACLADSLEAEAVAESFAATLVDGSTEDLETLLASSVGSCPEVASEILLAEAPAGLTPEAEACVRAFVNGNPDLVSDAFTSGEGDSAATQRLGVELAAACPEDFGA